MTPFFSVIIPTLNEEKNIPILLESIITQSYRSFEIIIIDGESKDRTLELAQTYQTKTASLQILSHSSTSIADQRNFGAAHAQGMYLIFMDADTKLFPDGFEKFHQQLVTISSDLCTIWSHSDTNAWNDRLVVFLINLLQHFSLFVQKPFFVGHFMCCKKEVFDATDGFDTTVTIAEDYVFCQTVFDRGYTLHIFTSPHVMMSLRRYRKEGRIYMLLQYIYLIINILFKGKHALTKKILDYPMGGERYGK
jgi:glycosyltransferase involved in cell wall biosynthesis